MIQNKVIRLEEYKARMMNVGSRTNDDITLLFDNLKEGVKKKRDLYQTPDWKWDSCDQK